MTDALTAGSGRRRWALYAAAWLPMLAAYFGAIMAGGGNSLDSFTLALHNTVPAALAGIGPGDGGHQPERTGAPAGPGELPARAPAHIVNLDHVSAIRPYDERRLSIRFADGSEVVASRAGSQALREMVR
jgi:hypothetical protein